MFSNKKLRKSSDIACIFVHAGAGYHSVQNESTHLQACSDAARSAMLLLKGGGSAVDAVEIAIKVLEDREITNAGYGSNLTADGVVECDAIVVDHFGRSGAAGAVAQVKNPISLARLLLEHTTRTLTLRRVPPNLLVGQGALEFAYEHGMAILPHDFLVSPAAKDRWRRWRADLDRAERNRRAEERLPYGLACSPFQKALPDSDDFRDIAEESRRAHTKAMRNGVWNDAQPISPPPLDDRAHLATYATAFVRADSSDTLVSRSSSLDMPMEFSDPEGPPGTYNASTSPFANSTQQIAHQTSTPNSNSDASNDVYTMDHFDQGPSSHVAHDNIIGERQGTNRSDHRPGPVDQRHSHTSAYSDKTTIERTFQVDTTPENEMQIRNHTTVPPLASPPSDKHGVSLPASTPRPANPLFDGHQLDSSHGYRTDEDRITDTVGAIAIDSLGNIASGASSGGIGMKHRGRIGPAALVGIGAAVIPVDVQDPERLTVATVTSGTGEHMGTTMAAGVCSNRMYHGTRRVLGGALELCEDEEALRGFIEADFMQHPSVKNSHSAGAIGVLTAKRTNEGIYLYFAHNTDSFALASMHANEPKPVCTMSRNAGPGTIANGARGIIFRRRKTSGL